jgi:ubiquinone/menaquinone biosynthesis C-methylase UbiE
MPVTFLGTLEKRTFKDLFSKQSKEYAVSRPTYPKSLFDFLAGLVERKDLAWDCATGNGQAAVALSKHFQHVIASDISKKQIENAKRKSNIRYEVFPAEKTALEDSSIDLVTVAQALHWFNFEEFYKEVKRVLRKNGVIAAWAYGLHSISPGIDKVTYHLYEDILGRYWPKERKYIESKYEDVPFPFK